MSYYHLFVKKRCPHCKEAVKVLKENKLEHVVSSMDGAPSALDKLKETADWKTVPIVFKVNEHNQYAFIGGCDDLKEGLHNENSNKDDEIATKEKAKEISE